MAKTKHEYATFTATTDEDGNEIPENRRKKIKVHFNPENLDITFTNALQQGRRNQPAQIVTETTAKLSMELVFDTTRNGRDVRGETHKIAKMMDPTQHTPRRRNASEVKVPSIVVFEWGATRFEGYIDSYKERIEYFSSEGVPLRATMTLSMTQKERNFVPGGQTADVSGGNGLNANRSPQNAAPVKRMGEKENMTDASKNLGDAGAARDLAAQNGVENLRHPEVDEIMVVNERGRAAPGLTPGFGRAFDTASTVSSMVPASVPMAPTGETTLQFEGLRSAVQAAANLVPRVKLALAPEAVPGQSLSMAGQAGVGIGGQVGDELGASLTADVGVDADIELGIVFED